MNAGVITTVAGNGSGGFSGDGGPATSAQLFFPASIALDAAGNLFIADTRNQRIRKVTPSGVITTIAGHTGTGAAANGTPALQAQLSDPSGITVDGAGNVYVSETGAHRVRQITTAGFIRIVAGNGTMGFSGDGVQGCTSGGGPASAPVITEPYISTVGGGNTFFIAYSITIGTRGLVSPVLPLTVRKLGAMMLTSRRTPESLTKRFGRIRPARE